MKLTIIIPCYNGGILLKNNLLKLFEHTKNDHLNVYEIVVVNDGSKDETLNILKNIKGITLLSYDENKGKGGAVKYGILHISKTDAVLIMDCDFSTSLDAISTCISEIKNYDVVIGSRFIKGSYLPNKRTIKRKIMSKCCNLFVNFLFHFHIKDTQCGFKCIKYDLAYQIATKQIINDWAFDVEYLYIAKLNNKTIKEIPITWAESDTSTVHAFVASKNFIKSLIKIKHNKLNY